MFTQKQMVEAKRDAFCDGAAFGRMQLASLGAYDWRPLQQQTEEAAKERFVFPKVRRNRTVVIESGVMGFKREVRWDAENHLFTITFHNGQKTTATSRYQVLLRCAINTPDSEIYLALLDDLQKNPTELVDADEAED